MLKSISLENYKCFRNSGEIEIAPLTVLCGINSSGKSSIINSLLLLKQSYEDNSISNNMKLNGAYVKGGRFKDISLKREDQLITLSVSYELEKPKRYEKLEKKRSKYDITACKNLAKLYSPYNVRCFRILSEVMVEQYNGKNFVDDNIMAGQKITIRAICEDSTSIISSVELKRLKNQINQYVIQIDNFPDGDSGELTEHVELRDATCYFENFNLINAFSSDIYPVGTQVSGLLANVYLIFKMNALQLKNIHYLTPLRGYPQRNYNLDCETDDVGISGEYTPYIMRKYGKKYIDGFLPPEKNKIPVSEKKLPFKKCVQGWLDYLNFGKYSLTSSLEAIQLNIQDYNVSNVGFGISQVLPIIVSGLIQKESEILLLEQPEIHLHPGAQMCMADFLVSMAMHNKGVIVETHSDHIINRVVRRAMESKEINNRMVIYFIEQDSEGISHVERVFIDPIRGVLIDNENFFMQFASETEKIVETGFNNLQKGNQNGEDTFG